MPTCKKCSDDLEVGIHWESINRLCPLCKARDKVKRLEQKLRKTREDAKDLEVRVYKLEGDVTELEKKTQAQPTLDQVAQTAYESRLSDLLSRYTGSNLKSASSNVDAIVDEAARKLSEEKGISFAKAKKLIKKAFKA